MSTISVVMWDPVKQFTGDDGRPVSLGQLISSDAGSTSPRPTYADAGLTTPNPNPLTLDAAGRATIFLDQAFYKFALFDALGAKVWERDNIAGSIWPGAVNAMAIKNAPSNTNIYGHQFASLLNKPSVGTNSVFAGVYIAAPSIGEGGATLQEAASLYIAGPPSGAALNYALHVAAGDVKITGNLSLGGQIPVGTGPVAELGKINVAGPGIEGPLTAAQAGWVMMQDGNGTQIFLPYWI